VKRLRTLELRLKRGIETGGSQVPLSSRQIPRLTELICAS